jgi:predicted GIY-YIG superfamily endonuclease
MEKKECSTCGEEKHLDDFYNRKDSKDGKFQECKECHKKRHKSWLKSEKGQAYLRRRNRRQYHRRKDDQEFIQRRREKDRLYYEQNRDKKLAAVKEYQARKAAKKKIQEIIDENPVLVSEVLKTCAKIPDLIQEGADLQPILEDLKHIYESEKTDKTE